MNEIGKYCVINAIQNVRLNSIKKTNSIYNVVVTLTKEWVHLNAARVDYLNDEFFGCENIEVDSERNEEWDLLIHSSDLGKFEQDMFVSRVLREVGVRSTIDSINVVRFR